MAGTLAARQLTKVSAPVPTPKSLAAPKVGAVRQMSAAPKAVSVPSAPMATRLLPVASATRPLEPASRPAPRTVLAKVSPALPASPPVLSHPAGPKRPSVVSPLPPKGRPTVTFVPPKGPQIATFVPPKGPKAASFVPPKGPLVATFVPPKAPAFPTIGARIVAFDGGSNGLRATDGASGGPAPSDPSLTVSFPEQPGPSQGSGQSGWSGSGATPGAEIGAAGMSAVTGAAAALNALRQLEDWISASSAALGGAPNIFAGGARIAGRVAAIVAPALAAIDINSAFRIWNDPNASLEDKIRVTAKAVFSAVAAGAAIAGLFFPPAGVVAALAGLGAFLADQWPAIQRMLGGAAEFLRDILSGTFDLASALANGFVGALHDVGAAVADVIGGAASALWSGISGAAGYVWDGVTGVAGSIADGLADAAGAVGDFLGDVFSGW